MKKAPFCGKKESTNCLRVGKTELYCGKNDKTMRYYGSFFRKSGSGGWRAATAAWIVVPRQEMIFKISAMGV
jgi:hypothetical protein